MPELLANPMERGKGARERIDNQTRWFQKWRRTYKDRALIVAGRACNMRDEINARTTMTTHAPNLGSDVNANRRGFHFGDALIERARTLGHCFCLGLDPHLAMIPAAFRRSDMVPKLPETIRAVEEFLTAVVDLAARHVLAVKPQSAFYERLGSPGVALLERIVAYAHARGILVLLDAKRGDIGSTADAYAEAYLAPDSPNPVDALTVNPYMGIDTLEPYLRLSAEFGRGVFVLLKTSNPGSGAVQDLRVDNTTVYGIVARALRPLSERLCGERTGWSSLGVVVGATYPGDALTMRTLLPNALFLFPGYGYQKGNLARISAALVPGPRKREGGLISSSRATLFPEAASAGSFDVWKAAFEDQLTRQIEDVADSL